MTVIAWDGKTLSADKQSDQCGTRRAVTKIHRASNSPFGPCLVAISGSIPEGMEKLDWFIGGARPQDFRDKWRGHESDAFLHVFCESGVYRFEGGPIGFRAEDSLYAGGSGADVAMGAMLAGADARTAVEIAIKARTDCGAGIDCLTLDGSEP